MYTKGKILRSSADHHAGWPLCKLREHRFSVPDLVSSPPPLDSVYLVFSMFDFYGQFVCCHYLWEICNEDKWCVMTHRTADVLVMLLCLFTSLVYIHMYCMPIATLNQSKQSLLRPNKRICNSFRINFPTEQNECLQRFYLSSRKHNGRLVHCAPKL